MSNSLYIRLNGYGGTSIEDASIEAVRIANLLQISVWFKFNDVDCLARPNDDAYEISASYFIEVKSTKQYKMASSNARLDPSY